MNKIRRELLKGLGVAAVAASPASLMAQNSRLSVGIVGSGILGASIGYSLAKAGISTTIFERTAPASGATSKSFAWLNASTDDQNYRDLRLKSLAAYHELDEQLDLRIMWGGYLHWAETTDLARRFRESARRSDQRRYPLQYLEQDQFAKQYPNLRPDEVHGAIYNGMDGHADPVHVTERFLHHAKKHGAKLVCPCEVTELELSGDRLVGVKTTQGRHKLDRLVIASGVDAPSLAAQTGYVPPLKHAPGILVHSKSVKPLIQTVTYGSGLHFKQFADGRIVGADSSYPPETPVHANIRDHRMEFPSEALRTMHAERILGKIKAVVPGARSAQVDRLTLGFRPLPQDGMPIAGFVPGSSSVYLAVMHSGVTLAPIVGRSISREIIDDLSMELLNPYRPDRFDGKGPTSKAA